MKNVVLKIERIVVFLAMIATVSVTFTSCEEPNEPKKKTEVYYD